ncbi:hypothetical protein HMPREF3189_00672 [Clostridiales bacterium KA00134]|nr:hypothetical protein HMPREF3189_00672 [Clostridiales bacterium KA00134]
MKLYKTIIFKVKNLYSLEVLLHFPRRHPSFYSIIFNFLRSF